MEAHFTAIPTADISANIKRKRQRRQMSTRRVWYYLRFQLNRMVRGQIQRVAINLGETIPLF